MAVSSFEKAEDMVGLRGIKSESIIRNGESPEFPVARNRNLNSRRVVAVVVDSVADQILEEQQQSGWMAVHAGESLRLDHCG